MHQDDKHAIEKLTALFEQNLMDQQTYETAVSSILGQPFTVGEGSVNVRDIHGYLITGNNNTVNVNVDTTDPEEALNQYRTVLVRSSENLPLRGVDVGASDPNSQQASLGLANVYVDLDTTAQVQYGSASGEIRITGSVSTTELSEETGESEIKPLKPSIRSKQRNPKPVSALQAVINNQRLVLTGDPGGGKSTFVNHLAYCLAGHQLNSDSQILDQLGEWPEELSMLLPLPVILRDFAATLSDELNETPKPNLLWNFIKDQLEKQNLTAVSDPLKEQLENGRVLLLLDGLDEVTTIKKRQFIRDVVLAFVNRYPENRYVVTCRILSYQPPEEDTPDLRLPGTHFPVAQLAVLDERKIEGFIEAWYAELARVGTVRQLDQHLLANRLKTAVHRPDLWRLAPNPLLLTVMALVHAHKGRLPDARALLYESTVDMLLWRWEEVKTGGQTDAPPLRQLLLNAGRGEMDLKQLLWQLAYEAQSQVENEADEEKVSDISESRLTRGLERLNRGDWNWVHQMSGAMKLRAGLLLERSPGVFTFPHRTFQEYLAGAHLSTQKNFSELATTHADEGALWWEVILLAVGRLVHLVGDTDKVYTLVNRLCPSNIKDTHLGWKNIWLAGDVLLEVGLHRVENDEWGAELLERVQKRLVQLITKGELSPQERANAGNTLGRIGDPRPGVCTPEPELMKIESGPFLMGENKDEIIIETAYGIGRYPVTNAQFRLFIEDGGYTETFRHCWTKEGWSWFNEQQRHEPRYWQDEKFNLPNQPVVGISWYEAVAYVQWLAETTGKPYRLPTEAEWERAARHKDGKAYPWGEEWQDKITNTREGQISRTSAVGIFPKDTAVCGAQDFGGNVGEWCQTRWENEEYIAYALPYQLDDGRELLEGNFTIGRVVKGGDWANNKEWSLCGARFRLDPHDEHNLLGFRVMLSPFTSAL